MNLHSSSSPASLKEEPEEHFREKGGVKRRPEKGNKWVSLPLQVEKNVVASFYWLENKTIMFLDCNFAPIYLIDIKKKFVVIHSSGLFLSSSGIVNTQDAWRCFLWMLGKLKAATLQVVHAPVIVFIYPNPIWVQQMTTIKHPFTLFQLQGKVCSGEKS